MKKAITFSAAVALILVSIFLSIGANLISSWGITTPLGRGVAYGATIIFTLVGLGLAILQATPELPEKVKGWLLHRPITTSITIKTDGQEIVAKNISPKSAQRLTELFQDLQKGHFSFADGKPLTQHEVSQVLEAAIRLLPDENMIQDIRIQPNQKTIHILYFSSATQQVRDQLKQIRDQFQQETGWRLGIGFSQLPPKHDEEVLQKDLVPQQLDSEHPDAAWILNSLGQIYSQRSKYQEAEQLYQEALAIYQQRLGSEHLATAWILNSLGQIYSQQGKYQEAEPLLRQALTILEQQLGADDSRTKDERDNYTSLLKEMGRTP